MKTLRLAVVLVLLACFSTLGFAQENCVEVQKKFDGILAHRFVGQSWAIVQEVFGNPTRTTNADGRIASFVYVFNGCQATFNIDNEGRISSKSFQLGAFPTSASPNQPTEVASPNRQSDVAETLKSLQSTLQQLRSDITKLERVLQDQKLAAEAAPRPATNTPIIIDHLATRSPFMTAIPTTSRSTGANPATILNPNPPTNTAATPAIAQNGSYYGQISETTGRPKTVPVRGYYRKDGTYVKPHYRSAPRRKN